MFFSDCFNSIYKGCQWDVAMGSYDGAEVCELVRLFILHQLQDTGLDLGLYRDDGLGVTKLKGRPLEKMRRKIQSILIII